MICGRCNKKPLVTVISRFNLDILCLDCHSIEKTHPDYGLAVAAEYAECEKGNYNYEGIGLPDHYQEWSQALIKLLEKEQK